MTTFYICRHGQTEYNLQKRLQGHIDTPITEEGVKNAHNVASKIKNINFDFIVSSDLGRAFVSAYIISRDLDYQKEIFRTKGLREVNFGDLSGLSISGAEEKYPKLQLYTKFVPPNGESLEQLQQRVFQFITNFAASNQNKVILLVTHDVVINAIFTRFKGIDFGPYNKEHYNPHNYVGTFVFDNNEILSFEEI